MARQGVIGTEVSELSKLPSKASFILNWNTKCTFGPAMTKIVFFLSN